MPLENTRDFEKSKVSAGSRDALEKNILATVAYYDALDYPLTSFEIWKYLMRVDYSNDEGFNKEYSLTGIVKILESSDLKSFIKESQGFYFLEGKSGLIEERIKRNKIANLKLKRLRRVVWVLRFIPFVRMIGVTGRLAMKNTEPQSDWDLLVVLRNGKIWSGRTLATLILQVIGKRRHGEKIQDRVCLNYFLTDKSLEIITKDIFSANEYFFMLVLFGCKQFSVFQLKNKWIKKFKPSYCLDETSNLRLVEDSKISKIAREMGEKIFSFEFIENWLRKLERRKIAKNPKTYQEGSLVQASDEALVFLPEPKGPKIFEKFKNRIENLEQHNNSFNLL